jgi:hypothetical protein
MDEVGVPSAAVVTQIPPESAVTESFEIPAQEARQARRREAPLVEGLKEWWIERDGLGSVCRLEIQPEGAPEPLYVDLFNRVTNELVEAKASCRRENIRMAIGQIADYRRFIMTEPICKVLLPEAPGLELLDLLWSQRIGVIVRGSQEFTELLPSELEN